MAGLIVTGKSPRDLDFVLAVCREKVRRGELTLAPCSEVTAELAELRKRNDEANQVIEVLKAEIAGLRGENENSEDDVNGLDYATDDMENLDTLIDDKELETSDTKDIVSDDSKTLVSGTPKSRKSKK